MKEAFRRSLHAGTAAALLVPHYGSWFALRAMFALALPAVVWFEWQRLRRPVLAEALARRVPAFRPEERSRVSGAVWLWVGYAIAVWFPPPASTAAILAGALADPAGSLVGRRWGSGAPKSWIGSAAVVAVAAVVTLLAGVPPVTALATGLLAGAVERWSGRLDDNLTIAPSVATFLWLVA